MKPLTMREVAAVMQSDDKPIMAAIAKDVAEKTGISYEQMCGSSRKRPIARARQLTMWKLHQEGITLSAIGTFDGGRDHTRVSWGIKVVNKLIEEAQ